MIYVCTVCGFVYDQTQQDKPFSELPSDWVCPWCGADKGLFEVKDASVQTTAPVVEPLAKIDDKPRSLNPMALSALCSNLARGCEKQYNTQAQADFQALSDWFKMVSPSIDNTDTTQLLDILETDLFTNYPTLTALAKRKGDRGTQRVCVWCEKVTRILANLLRRYIDQGPSLLDSTNVWVCSVCGFVYVGDDAPELCPVCKVPSWKFDKIESRRSA